MTPASLIVLALKLVGVLGVGQTPAPEDMADAFLQMQMMLAQWQQRRWLVYHLVDTSITSTGALSYTVGTGGDFSVLRPAQINAGFFRQINGPQAVDFPMEFIWSREDYDRVTLKSQVSFPRFVYYDGGYPLGTLYPSPIPTGGAFQIHITTKADLGALTSLTQTLNLPPEYSEAILYNLAARLFPMYSRPPDPAVVGLARAALETLRNANAQIPSLQLPAGLPGRGGWYNPYSDQSS